MDAIREHGYSDHTSAIILNKLLHSLIHNINGIISRFIVDYCNVSTQQISINTLQADL